MRTDSLKGRVLAAKARIDKTKGSYIDRILLIDPSYNTIKGGYHLENVWNLRSADEKITEIIEKIADEDSPVVKTQTI